MPARRVSWGRGGGETPHVSTFHPTNSVFCSCYEHWLRGSFLLAGLRCWRKQHPSRERIPEERGKAPNAVTVLVEPAVVTLHMVPQCLFRLQTTAHPWSVQRWDRHFMLTCRSHCYPHGVSSRCPQPLVWVPNARTATGGPTQTLPALPAPPGTPEAVEALQPGGSTLLPLHFHSKGPDVTPTPRRCWEENKKTRDSEKTLSHMTKKSEVILEAARVWWRCKHGPDLSHRSNSGGKYPKSVWNEVFGACCSMFPSCLHSPSPMRRNVDSTSSQGRLLKS